MILTEADLRSRMLPEGTRELAVPEGAVVTPAAADYLQKRGIALRRGQPSPGAMTQTPIPRRGGKAVFVDAATGRELDRKPEEMTHLRGNLLVPKTHPQIRFRGGVDSLEAQVIQCQVTAREQGLPGLCACLGEVLDCLRQLLRAEVRDQPLEMGTLFGYDQTQLRRLSHHIQELTGQGHPVPQHQMGRMAAELNRLRTQIREVELLGALAFDGPGGCLRPDLIQCLNRLSSGVYILFCCLLAGRDGVNKR